MIALRLGTVAVRGASMAPRLRDGDFLLVRWGAPVRPGGLAGRRDGLDRPLDDVLRRDGRLGGEQRSGLAARDVVGTALLGHRGPAGLVRATAEQPPAQCRRGHGRRPTGQ